MLQWPRTQRWPTARTQEGFYWVEEVSWLNYDQWGIPQDGGHEKTFLDPVSFKLEEHGGAMESARLLQRHHLLPVTGFLWSSSLMPFCYIQLVSKTLEGHEMEGDKQSLGWIGQSCWCRGGGNVRQLLLKALQKTVPHPGATPPSIFSPAVFFSFLFFTVSSFSLFLYTIVLPSQKKTLIIYPFSTFKAFSLHILLCKVPYQPRGPPNRSISAGKSYGMYCTRNRRLDRGKPNAGRKVLNII